MKTIDEILKILEEDEYAMIARPMTDDELAQCNADMVEVELNELPDGYADFLRKANGFAWNGIEFYSTYCVTDPDNDYKLMDIVSMNDDWTERFAEEGADNYVFLGRSDMDIYAYSIEKNQYEVLEEESFEAMEEYETFAEMFAEAVVPRMAAIEELSEETD